MILDDINHKISIKITSGLRKRKVLRVANGSHEDHQRDRLIGLPSGYDIHSLPWKITIFSGINDGIPSGSDMTFTVCELEKSLINGGI
jgi:hypothetical protein